jgi:hypothetical protein
MTETVKKTKAPAKPRAASTKTKDKTASAKVTVIAPSREEIAMLAHKLWKERGGHHGSHEQDWLRAEQHLRGMAS